MDSFTSSEVSEESLAKARQRILDLEQKVRKLEGEIERLSDGIDDYKRTLRDIVDTAQTRNLDQ